MMCIGCIAATIKHPDETCRLLTYRWVSVIHCTCYGRVGRIHCGFVNNSANVLLQERCERVCGNIIHIHVRVKVIVRLFCKHVYVKCINQAVMYRYCV